MAIACPACNKAGQTEPVCARCGCDLSQLHAIVDAAATRLAGAAAALANRDWSGALAAAEQSWQLVHTGESARLAWVAAAASGDTACALRWHGRAAEASGAS